MPGVYGTPPPGYGYPAPYGPYGYQPRPVKNSVVGLGTAVNVLLLLDAVFATLALGALAWRNSILDSLLDDRLSVASSTVESSDNLVRAADGFLGVTVLGTIVVFMCWFHAARSNAEAYNPDRGTMGVGWAIGGWFIPLACWVIPCIVARDIYRATMLGRKENHYYSGGKITGWWWGVFVTSWVALLVLSNANGKTDKAMDPVEYMRALRNTTRIGLVALPLLIAAAILAIAYVRTITSAQKARNAEQQRPGAQMPGFGYGYGFPMPGQMPTPVPAQNPPTLHDLAPAAETQTAAVVDENPFAAPDEKLVPPT